MKARFQMALPGLASELTSGSSLFLNPLFIFFDKKIAKKVRVVRQILSAFLPVVADPDSCRYMQTNFLKIFLVVRNCSPIFALSKRNND